MTSVTHLTNQSQFVQANASFNGTNITGTIGSNGISLSVANPGAGGGAAISGGANSQNTGTVNFSNSNGVSFGLSNNGVMTASVNTNYQAPGAYLTTAALSQDSSKYAGINGAITGGSITVNTSGVSINLPAYLTTAQPVGAYLTTAMASNRGSDFVQATAAFAGTNATGTIASNGISVSVNPQTAFIFSNSNGVSFGTNGSTVTATVATNYQSQGAYLTTAMASNRGSDFVQANAVFNGTNASGTIASNGISISVAAPAAGVGIVAGTRTATTANNLLFDNANGITFGLNAVGGSVMTASHNGLTTAALSNHSHNLATTTTNGSLIVIATTNSNGATFAVPPYLTTAQAPGAYLTTARASNDAIGLNTALTGNGVSVTANSSGLSINVPAFLTTAALSNHSHGNPTLALTNLSGTTASNSAGLTLSLSAAAPGGGAAVTVSASNGSFTVGQLNFSNANNVTFGTSAGSIVTASVAAPGGGAAIANYWAIPPWGENSHALLTNLTATAMTQRPFFMPFQVAGSLTAPLIKWVMSRATSGSNAFTVQAGVYSYANSTSLALIGSNQHVFSNTATASISGIKQFQVTLGTEFSTLPPGQYYLGMNFSAANTASMNYSLMGIATGNFPNQTVMLAGTNSHITYTSNAIFPFWGRYSTTTGAMPAGLTYGQVISQTSSNFQMNFTLGQSV
jgi:hypothetical protein